MTDSIWQVIARLRRAQPRNPDTMALCDACEAAMRDIHKLEDVMVGEHAARKAAEAKAAEAEAASLFDRKAWMREYMRAYMRKRRAKAKDRK